jgi:hypothetical protein
VKHKKTVHLLAKRSLGHVRLGDSQKVDGTGKAALSGYFKERLEMAQLDSGIEEGMPPLSTRNR